MSDSFATPWTIALQSPLSREFPRQEYWSGQGIFQIQELNLCLVHWQVGSLPLSHQGSPYLGCWPLLVIPFVNIFSRSVDCLFIMLIVSFTVQKLLRLSRSHLFVFAFGSFTTRPASWEICRQVKKQQLELEMKQQTGSKSGKEYVKDVYYHPAFLTYMQSTSWEMLGWMKHRLESRFPGKISINSDIQVTPPYGRKQRRTKEPLGESERGEWKSWLEAQHSEN